MLDATTMALRAALLVRKGFANANGYGYSVGSIGSMATQSGNKISYTNGSIGTLRTQQGGLLGGVTRERIEDAICYNANKPIGILSEKVLTETGEQTASESANKIALENATGGGSQNSTSAQGEPLAYVEPTNDFPTNGDSTAAPTQQQAQVSFFEKNKKTILIAAIFLVVVAVFFWKK